MEFALMRSSTTRGNGQLDGPMVQAFACHRLFRPVSSSAKCKLRATPYYYFPSSWGRRLSWYALTAICSRLPRLDRTCNYSVTSTILNHRTAAASIWSSAGWLCGRSATIYQVDWNWTPSYVQWACLVTTATISRESGRGGVQPGAWKSSVEIVQQLILCRFGTDVSMPTDISACHCFPKFPYTNGT